MNIITLTPEQRDLARHALGLPNRRCTSYRNRFVTGPGSLDFSAWEAMVAFGAAKHRPGTILTGGNDLFWLTRDGAEAALERGERLDPEDFPPTGEAA